MAQQDVLPADAAVAFCGKVLPQLIAELEVLQRLTDTKFSSLFAPQQEEPPVVVVEPQPEKPSKKPRKARKPRNARRNQA